MTRPPGPTHDPATNTHCCKLCEEWLTYDQFYTRNATTCRSCLKAIDFEKRKERVLTALAEGRPVVNPHGIGFQIELPPERKCGKCLEVKSLDAFRFSTESGLPHHICTDCVNERRKTYGYVSQGDVLSSVLCACGCGEFTKYNRKTKTGNTFKAGHYAKTLPRQTPLSNLLDYKECSKCNQTKSKEMFTVNSRTIGGLYSYCKDCKSIYDKEKSQIPTYQIKKKIRDTTRRAREKGAPGTFTQKQLEDRYEYFGNKCYICGTTKRLTTDHLKSLEEGGSNWPANLRPCCLSCDSAKKDRPWRNYAKIGL